jgi:hypothetical protein
MCMSAPKIPPPPEPPAPPPPSTIGPAKEAKTVAQMQPKKKARGAQAQLKRSRPTLGGSSGGTGVYMSS